MKKKGDRGLASLLKDMREKVAIIGMGISGMGVLNAYAERQLEVEIHCYDQKTSFGKGYPFRKDSNEVLLNVRPSYISDDPNNPEGFVEWLDERNYSYEEYVPRHILGEYLSESLENRIEEVGAVKHLEDVRRLSYDHEKEIFEIETMSGKKDTFDRIHLCAGELPPKDFYNLQGDKQYLGTLYPVNQRLLPIKKGDHVGIIGTSLSAFDVVRYLYLNQGVEDIVIFSRSNVFPTVRLEKLDLKAKYFTEDAIKAIRRENKGYISFKDVDDLITKEYHHHGIETDYLLKNYDQGFDAILRSLEGDEMVSKIQSLYPAMIDAYNESYYGMNQTDKKKFKEKHNILLQLFGAPTPIETGELLKKMYQEGALKIIEDAFEVLKDEETGLFHILKETEHTTRIAAKLHWMINATGVDNTLSSVRKNSLLYQLKDDEIIQVGEQGGVLVHEEGHCAISKRFGVLDKLHAHGVLISGVQMINNDVVLLQNSAKKVLKALY